MRTFTTILASSVFFGSSTPAFSSSGRASTGQFSNNPGGAQQIFYTDGYALQGMFGGNGNPSSGLYGGRFNLLVGNVFEAPMMTLAASAQVSSTGSIIFNVTGGNTKYCDFQFIPSSASTSGFLTVVITSKGKQ